MADKEKKSHSYIKICVLAIFVVGILYYNLKDNAQHILTALQTLSILDVLLLIFASALVYIISGAILTELAKKVNPKYRFRDGCNVSFITMFTTNMMFSASSKLVQYYLFYAHKLKMDATTCIIALEFLSYQIIMMLCSLLMMGYYHTYFLSYFPSELPLAWFGTLISFLPLIAISLLLWYPPIQQVLIRLVRWAVNVFHLSLDLPALEEKLAHFMQMLINIKDDFLHDHPLLWKLVLLNILRHIVKHGLPILIAWVLQIPLTLTKAWMLFVLSMFLDLWLTGIPITGKHGVAEAGFIAIYSIVLGSVQASAMMILWRFTTFYSNTILGGICLILSSDISMKKIRQLKKDNDIPKN